MVESACELDAEFMETFAGARLLLELRKPENKEDVLAALWEARQSAVGSLNYELAAAFRDLEWEINGGPTSAPEGKLT